MQPTQTPPLYRRSRWLISGIILLCLLGGGWLQRHASAAPADPVTAAWTRARARGAYHFTSELWQTTTPLATLGNVGRSSRQTALHLEGATDLRAATMNLRLWAQEGSVSQPASGVEVRVRNGKTQIRQNNTATADSGWQDAGDITGALAPNGDFLTFLAGLRAIKPLGTTTRAGITFTRYGFQLDGPAIADQVRQQMEAALRQRGELLPGLTLQTPASYAQMTGSGELWVDHTGLPLRQILDVHFPAQRDEAVAAHIVTDFSNFAPAQAVAGLGGAARQDLALTTFGLLLGVACTAVVITGRRSHTLYTALAVALILATVAGPLLQNLRLGSLIDAQTARAAAQEQQQDQNSAMRMAQEVAAPPTFDPHVDPLTASTVNEPPPIPPLPTPEPLTTTTDNGVDTDHDGLTDFAEERIGTSTVISDTDGDGVTDGVEVKGFPYKGQSWFGDPLQRDSNNDSQADTLEWLNDANHDNLPDDSDGDGVPDAFDTDNDGDGVPDAQDLSPYARMQPNGAGSYFNDATPLRYQVNHLQTGSPTFVDLQLRPRNDKHLWYALNVLDWPQDVEGQLQDGDGKTFADLPGSNALANPADANGDMKLIPMLEIRVPTGSANLAPASDLFAYNVAVTNLSQDGATKVLYAPLRLTTDDKSGARVAFNARLPLWAVGPWEQPYDVRLVWVVQALTDLCDQVVDGLCQHYNVQNRPQVIQSYPDEWLLTGLSVREEHGSALATIYEDPAVDAERKEDGALFLLAHGLDNSFLVGRDQNHDHQRDLTVAEIARRFDHITNGAVTEDERWAIPNTLRVEAKSYDTLDRALMTTTMTETKRILNANFATPWAQDKTLKPLLLFAHEERYRSQSLDGLNGNSANNGYVHQHSNLLVVDLDPTGFTPTPLAVNTGLKWTLYCSADSSAPTWNACDPTTVWNEVATRYADGAGLPGDDAETSLGRMGLIRLYFMALAQGVNSLVQQDATIIVPDTGFKTDQGLAATIRGVIGGGGKVVSLIVSIATSTRELTNNAASRTMIKMAAWAGYRGFEDQLKRMGATGLIKTRLKALWATSKTTVIVGTVIVAVIALGAIATLVFFKFSGNPVLEKVVGGVILIAVVLVSLYSLINAITAVVQVIQGLRALFSTGAAIATTLRGSSALAGTTRAAGVVGAVIQVGIVWGFFIYQMIDAKTSVFSPQFNAALAQAIAATILIITLAVLAATVVGLIIVGIIALIDAILTAICELGVDELRKVPGLGGACFTLNGAATAALAKILYAYDSMIDTSRTDLVVTSGPRLTLADPTRGYVADNPLTIGLNLTTTVVHLDPSRQNQTAFGPYGWFFSIDNIKGTTFRYTLTQGAGPASAAQLHEMDSAWQTQIDHTYSFLKLPMFRAQSVLTPQLANVTLPAGVNQSPNLYLNTSYALPAYECWLALLAPICYVRKLAGQTATKLEQLKVDILPPTLDQFMALAEDGHGGFKLGWDAYFGSLADADGDGLRSVARQGNDPNDATWDADGDGLSDAYELQWRSQGVALSPVNGDTDGDGLSDAQEVQLGTNPASKDTDNDGLADGEEVYHQVYAFTNGVVVPTNTWVGGWDVVLNDIQQTTVRVSSDPTAPDSDNDGISDQAEKGLAQSTNKANRVDPDGRPYDPLIVNRNPLVVQVTVNDVDRIVKPGQALTYRTTVANLGAPFTAGRLVVNAPTAFDQPVSTYRLDLDQANLITKTTNLVVTNAPTQQVVLTSAARARLVNPNPVLWQWSPAAAGTLGTFSADRAAWQTSLAPANLGRQDRYLLTASQHSATPDATQWTQVFPGHVGVWNTFTGNAKGFGAGDSGLHDASPTDGACNAYGRCLAVWSQYRTTDGRSVIMATITTEEPTTVLVPEFVLAVDNAAADYGHYFHPVVATDGRDFLVAWERVTQQVTTGQNPPRYFMSAQIVAQRFNDSGVTQSLVTLLTPSPVTAGLTAPMRISYLNSDLLWVGDAYRVLWSQPNGNLQIADFTSTGNAIANSQRTIATDALTTVQTPPQLAYDPISGRIIVAYLGTGNLANTILFQNRADTSSGVVTNQRSAVGAVGIAYQPLFHGWLLTWARQQGVLEYMLLNSDSTIFTGLAQQAGTWSVAPRASFGTSLTCPAATAQPVLTLPLEELPGATTFADTSGWNAATTCSGAGCPQAGIDGAPNAPLSDYGVRFNGGQKVSATVPGLRGNRFSLAFWLRTSAATGGDFALVTSDFWRFVLHDGKLNYVSNTVNVTSNVGVADGQWHHIAVAQNEFTAWIYVDGQAVTPSGDSSTAGNNAPGNLSIGGFASNTSFFTGEIDHLAVYNTTLDQATVQALKDRTMNSYCLAAAASSTTIATLKLALQAPDVRGGVINSSAGLTLTVDAEAPTSLITSLTDGAYLQGTPGAPQTFIIGGNATDAYGVQQTNISVNGGPFQPATGGATWVYPLAVTEGRYALQSQAVDVAGNVESAPRTTTVIVDASAPQIATDFSANARLTPVSLTVGQWLIGLQGTVSDPAIAGGAGSGVQQVEVLLQNRDLNVKGNGWQPATVNDQGIWFTNYALGSAPTLTGAYTVTVRATDRVGNQAMLVRPVTLDSAGPNAQLSIADTASAVFSGTVTISGRADDPDGVNSVAATFVPIQRMRAISDTLLFLPLDETADERNYHDLSPLHTDVNCVNQCITGQPGQNQGALHMIPDQAGPVMRPQAGEFDFTAQTSFSLQSWLRTTQTDGVIMSKEDSKRVGYALLLQGGQPTLRLNNRVILQGSSAVNDNRWHQLVVVFDATLPQVQLYVDGVIVAKDTFSADLVDPNHPKWPLVIGGAVGDTGYANLMDAYFDDVGVFKTALSPYLVQALYHTETTVYQAATLTTPGAAKTLWQITVPAGLEGQYQLDLHTTDTLANQALQSSVWRGTVDTLAPRLSFTAQPTGNQFNAGNGASRYEIVYSYSAEDRYLSDGNFSGPCTDKSALLRDFAADADVGGLFPDLTLRNRLQTSCTVWELSPTPATTVTACDSFGLCSTATPVKPAAETQVSSAAVSNVETGEPSALLLAPTNHSILGVDPGQVLTVTVAAQAAANLRQVVILLDNTPMTTLDFAQADGVKVAQRTVTFQLPAFNPEQFEGEHTLVAQASDWAGNSQHTLFPATVTFDTHDPTVDLGNDTLTSADGYGLSNSMMRLHGRASDQLGLAAVQISINDGPFTDVTFDAQGNWHTALWLGDEPAGRSFKFTLRAIDRGGHQTRMGKTLVVDVPARLAVVETTISDGPTDSTDSTNATFHFSGVDAQGNVVSSFQCQLDGEEFTPCTSPQAYSSLSQGKHLFRVFGSNASGAIDPTPAQRIWQVGAVTAASQQIFLPLIAQNRAQVQVDTATAASPASVSTEVTAEAQPLPVTLEDAATPTAGTAGTSSITLYLPVIQN